jgi:hypothetical protein
MDRRYLGNGSAYLPGIPARDLQGEEMEGLAKRRGMTVKQFEKYLDDSGLYRERGGSDPVRPASRRKPAEAAPVELKQP